MSNDFNWQTDDNNAWEEGAEETHLISTGAALTAWLKRRWRRLGVAAVLLLIIGIAIYSLFNRQVEKVEDANTAGVLAAHALVRQAALEKDFELLAVLMADNGRGWNEMQLELLNIDLFLDRRPLGLTMLPGNGSGQTNNPQVSMSPDLQTAELVEQIPYQIEDNGQTILLEQTFYYQRRGESWLLTPLPDEEAFWGDRQTIEKEYLTIEYTQREEAFVTGYLAEKMDTLIGRICEDNTVECPPGLKIELSLIPDPAGLRILNLDISDLSLGPDPDQFHFLLPTPTMVGRPIDDAGRESLYHGYASWLAAAMVYSFTDQQLQREEIENKLAAWELALLPEPVAVLPLTQRLPAAPIPFPEQDILLACINNTPSFKMLRYSPRTNSWLDELANGEPTYLSSDIQLIGGVVVVPLNDDSGVLLKLDYYFPDRSPFKIILWRDGQDTVFLESGAPFQLMTHPAQQLFDPSGRNLIIQDGEFGQPPDFNADLLPYAVNVEACLSGNCQYRDYNGYPHWSSDLAWTLVINPDDELSLTLRNEETGEEITVGTGYHSLWLNDRQFVYVHLLGSGSGIIDPAIPFQIIEATVEEPPQGTVLLESADIAAVMGNDPGLPVYVRSIIAHPDRPDWLFLTASTILQTAESGSNFLLSYRRDTDELVPLLNLNDDFPIGALEITADGKHLFVAASGGSDSPRSYFIRIIPLEPADMSIGAFNETIDVSARAIGVPDFTNGLIYDWSQDGRWLLVAGQDELRLIAPGHNYDHAIPHNLSNCTGAAWIDP